MFAGKGVDNSTKGQEKRKRKICHDTSSSPNSFPDTQPTTHKHKREKKCSADSVPETKTNGGILLQRIQSPFIASWAFFVTRPQKKSTHKSRSLCFPIRQFGTVVLPCRLRTADYILFGFVVSPVSAAAEAMGGTQPWKVPHQPAVGR